MTPPFATAEAKPSDAVAPSAAHRMSITIAVDGPYLVHGGVPLTQEAITPVGGHVEYRAVRTFPQQETYALCRCGHTSTPPYCDGSHLAAGFHGEETASRATFEERADVIPGPGVTLLDDNRCAFARFCHREDGDVWTLTQLSDDERLEREAVKASSDCPAGRLVHVDSREGTLYEPRLGPAITMLEDPQEGVSGPLYVQGGVPLIGSDGIEYEQRNRYALCRCGSSRNKPFCDAMHVNVEYRDGMYDFNHDTESGSE